MIMPITLDDVTFLGSGLNRPECLVTHESGWIFAADGEGSGGIARIAARARGLALPAYTMPLGTLAKEVLR